MKRDTDFSRSLLTAALFLTCGLAAAQFGGGPDIATVVLTQGEATPGGTTLFAVRVSVPEGYKVNAHEPLEAFLIPTDLTLEPPEGVTVAGYAYPAAADHYLEGSDERMVVYKGTFDIGVQVRIGEELAPGSYPIPAALRYQACDDKSCWAPQNVQFELPLEVVAAGTAIAPNDGPWDQLGFGGEEAPEGEPRTEDAAADEAAAGGEDAASGMPLTLERFNRAVAGFEVTGRNSGYIQAGDFTQWLAQVASGEASASLNQFAGKSILWIALATFLGGILLNLTPCVLPMIPINLAIIGAGAQAESKGRGFYLGLIYGLGIALVYGVLGVLASIAGTAFGAIQQSPWFNYGIAVVFVVLGLAMFDLIRIDFSRWQSKVNVQEQKEKHGNVFVAFFMGCVVALLAGACVGPVVISVIIFAQNLYTQGNPFGLALPFLLGIGMALPWPFAGASMSFLPKPGKWMEYVKYAFGAFIIAMAVYYGYLGYSLTVDEGAVKDSVAQAEDDLWCTDLAAALEESRETGKPIFVDFWATWCKNCLTMNKTTFKDEAVKQALGDYIPVKYQAEDLNAQPTKGIMEHFGIGGYGLPVYVVAEPPGE